MKLKLTLNSTTVPIAPADRERMVDAAGLAIGRDADNDWVLPDPHRHLSKNHCVVEFRFGSFHLRDTSTNGVFVNDAVDRVPRGGDVILRDGDRFRLGDYVIAVSAGATTAAAPAGAADPFQTLEGPFAPPMGAATGAASDPFADETGHAARREADPFAGASGGGDPLADDPLADEPAANVMASRRGGAPVPVADDFADPFGDEALVDPLRGGDSGRAGDLPKAAARYDPFAEPQAAPGIDTEEDPFGVGAYGDAWKEPPQRDDVDSPSEFYRPPSAIPAAIPEDWEAAGETFADGPASAPPTSVSAPPAAERQPLPPTAAPAPPEAGPIPAAASPAAPRADMPAAATASEASSALHAFLQGAGIESVDLRGRTEAEVMHGIGETYREMVDGLRDALLVRATTKGEFRLEQTSIRPKDNNPLKFSFSVEQAMRALLSRPEAGYMPASRAVQEGFDDLQAHQLAVIAGMQVALRAVLGRFDPQALETRLEQRSGIASLLPGSRGARYWEQFNRVYREIASEAEDQFQGLFGREFGRAYEEQARKLKAAREADES